MLKKIKAYQQILWVVALLDRLDMISPETQEVELSLEQHQEMTPSSFFQPTLYHEL